MRTPSRCSLPWRAGLLVSCLLAPAMSGAHAQAYPPRLTPDQIREVRSAFDRMRTDPRGPYSRLRWFCNDGSVLPPAGTPCAELGGGVQHAELSDLALGLRNQGFHVGTILQGTDFDELYDPARNHYRLKELVIAQHLFDVDDGWILREARYYRGARQIEDEGRSGGELLTRLLRDEIWTNNNFLLVYLLAATIPHESISDVQLTTRIRNLATELAALDERYQRLRIKIHSLPGREDLTVVASLLRQAPSGTEAHLKLTALREELTRQYDPNRTTQAFGQYSEALPRFTSVIEDVQAAYETGDARGTLSMIGYAATAVRNAFAQVEPRKRLAALDLLRMLHDQAFVIAQDVATVSDRTTRARRVEWLAPYVTVARAAGFLSEREANAIGDEVRYLANAATIPAMDYRTRLGYIGRALEWGMASARSTFGGVHQHYQLVEPKAATFLDALVRASVLLPLSNELTALSVDADAVLGASHVLLGSPVSQGARGLNPGVALKPMEFVPADVTDIHFDPNRIYVLQQTSSELRPVAGVVTLDEGNLLSHVQLLARNLGIPNAAVSPAFAEQLQPWNGREVFYAVSPLGRVFLKDPARLTPAERTLVAVDAATPAEKITLDTSRLNLNRRDPVLLDSLRATDAGVIVGPKAANLGQLMAYFPDNVAPGVALPFGMFYEHVSRPFEGARPLDRLGAAYEEAARMRAAGRDAAEVQQLMFQALADVRRAIVSLDWQPDMYQSIVDAINQTFDGDAGSGVFVRSDTNVEDLPQFSGAGLNLTVAHKTTVEAILASIKQVWTSPFSERAYLWRSQILNDQSEVFPSVLLLRTVPSEKSGVLITTGLGWGGNQDLTISTAEGVGGAVDGEETETLVVHAGSDVRLLSQAKAPYRRVPVYSPSGGITSVPSARPDYLLAEGDIDQLQSTVLSWKNRFPGGETQVWDIEFGFVDGKLWLFQIRPFVRFRNSAQLERLSFLDRDILANANRPVSMGEPLR